MTSWPRFTIMLFEYDCSQIVISLFIFHSTSREVVLSREKEIYALSLRVDFPAKIPAHDNVI